MRGSDSDAERALRDMVAAAQNGTARFVNATFGELCHAWLDAVSPRLASNTVVETSRIRDHHLLPALGDTPLRKLRSQHFDNSRIFACDLALCSKS